MNPLKLFWEEKGNQESSAQLLIAEDISDIIFDSQLKNPRDFWVNLCWVTCTCQCTGSKTSRNPWFRHVAVKDVQLSWLTDVHYLCCCLGALHLHTHRKWTCEPRFFMVRHWCLPVLTKEVVTYPARMVKQVCASDFKIYVCFYVPCLAFNFLKFTY